MKRIIATSVAVIMVASFASLATAGGRRGKGKHNHMKGDRIMKVFGKLDLSAEQQTAIETIQKEARAEAEPLRQQGRNLMKQVREAWNNGSPDEKAIIALHRQVHALKGQLAELRIEARIDTLAVLTAEQKEKLASLKAERKAKWAERKANGKGKRSGKKGRGKGFGKGMSADPAFAPNPGFVNPS